VILRGLRPGREHQPRQCCAPQPFGAALGGGGPALEADGDARRIPSIGLNFDELASFLKGLSRYHNRGDGDTDSALTLWEGRAGAGCSLADRRAEVLSDTGRTRLLVCQVAATIVRRHQALLVQALLLGTGQGVRFGDDPRPTGQSADPTSLEHLCYAPALRGWRQGRNEVSTPGRSESRPSASGAIWDQSRRDWAIP
jgi:hypothetical protein